MLEDSLVGLAGVSKIRDGDTRFVVLALFSSLLSLRCAVALGSLAIDPACPIVLSLLFTGSVGRFGCRFSRCRIVGDGLTRGGGREGLSGNWVGLVRSGGREGFDWRGDVISHCRMREGSEEERKGKKGWNRGKEGEWMRENEWKVGGMERRKDAEKGKRRKGKR